MGSSLLISFPAATVLAAEEGTSDLLNWIIDELYDLVTGTKESELPAYSGGQKSKKGSSPVFSAYQPAKGKR